MPNPRHKTRKAPAAGTVYVKRYKGKTYSMKVVSHLGQTGYCVAGVTYKTPTAAANSISEAPINGWTFWGIGVTYSTNNMRRRRSVTMKQP